MSIKKCIRCRYVDSLCECKEITLSGKLTKIYEKKAVYNKYLTVLEGKFEKEDLVYLKKKLGCGGSIYNDRIEIRGKHKEKIEKNWL